MSKTNLKNFIPGSVPFVEGEQNEDLDEAQTSLTAEFAAGTSHVTEEDSDKIAQHPSILCQLNPKAQEFVIENFALIHENDVVSAGNTHLFAVSNAGIAVNNIRVESSSSSSSSSSSACFLAHGHLALELDNEDVDAWNTIATDTACNLKNEDVDNVEDLAFYDCSVVKGSDPNEIAISASDFRNPTKDADDNPKEQSDPRNDRSDEYNEESNPKNDGDEDTNEKRSQSRPGAYASAGINLSSRNDTRNDVSNADVELPQAQPVPLETLPVAAEQEHFAIRAVPVLSINYSVQIKVLSAVIFVALVVFLALFLQPTGNSSIVPQNVKPAEPSTSSILPPSPLSIKDTKNKTRLDAIYDVLVQVSGQEVLNDKSSTQYFFMKWLVEDDEAQILPDDANRLIQRYIVSLFFSTGISWRFLDGGSECNWNNKGRERKKVKGAQCDSKEQVNYLHFSHLFNERKPFPYEIAFLTDLTDIDLSHNNIVGSLPTSFGLLSNLLYLDLSRNLHHGSVPSEIGLLTKIETMNLASCNLTGSIPSEIEMLANLEYLELSDNYLMGTIPPSLFRHLPNITYINFQDNILTGTMSTSLGKAFSLKQIFLSNNKLDGTIPHEIGMLTNLVNLGLAKNSLSNTIPMSLGNLSNLEWLSLNNNPLTGTIPISLKSLAMLKCLHLPSGILSNTVALSSCQLGPFGEKKPLSIEASSASSSTILYQVNVGGSLYVDTSSNTWSGDQFYSVDSWGYDHGEATSTTNPISNTDDDILYQTSRSSPSFEYKFDNLPDGKYQVNLHLAEVYFTKSNMRKVNVILEGELMLFDYDIYTDGGQNSAKLLSFYTNVLDSQLNILLQAMVGDAKVSALEVILLSKNLVTNGGFERGTVGWRFSSNLEKSILKKNGIYSVLVQNRHGFFRHRRGIFQDMMGKMENGLVYEISAWVKLKRASSALFHLKVEQIDGAGRKIVPMIPIIAVDHAWVKVVGSFLLNVTGSLDKLELKAGQIDVAYYLDDVSVVSK